jgi:uncharacterized repeat protein (TIGR01451 family)
MPNLSIRFRGWGRAGAIAFLSLFTSSIFAIVAPPPSAGKPSLQTARMLDARVNLKSSYENATAFRAAALNAGLAAVQLQARSLANAAANYKHSLPSAQIRLSDLTGAPRLVKNPGGSLTSPAPGRTSESIVRSFLMTHADVFGLSFSDLADVVALGDSAGGSSGFRMLRMEQQIDGRPIFQSETRFLLQRNGSLTAVVGQLIPDARALTPAVDWSSALSAGDAIASLLVASGHDADASAFSVKSDDGGRLTLSQSHDFLSGDVSARQVYFPLAPGLLVPAWSITAFTRGDQDWYAVVDAQTGDLLWRKNIRDYASAQDARFRVYLQADGTTPADSPAPASPNNFAVGSGTQAPAISPTIVSMHTAYDPLASPNGWINDCPGGTCTDAQTQTLGNNVVACLDRISGAGAGGANSCDTATSSVLDGNGRPTGNPDSAGRNRDFLGTTPRDFETNFLPPPQGGNPDAGQTAAGDGNNGTLAIDQFRRGSVTNLFYVVNWYHDRLYELGFDEAAGNFQTTNFSGMGSGGDPVAADAQDGSGTDNSNFATPPDGASGRMQMYIFTGTNTGTNAERDGSLDAEIMMHELTHGTSNRLVGNAAGITWDPAAGMGEGWSDFFALSLLNNTNADDPNGRYAMGGYATYEFIQPQLGFDYKDNYIYGIRRFPVTTDKTINPLTWADVDDVTNNLSGGIAPDPLGNNFGGGMEVHNAGEVWANTLWGVRARIIADPSGANGDVPTGNHKMLQLVVDGLKLTPNDPSFTDARDAILDADCATNACANETSIWGGFADRGLGYGALTPYNVSLGVISSHMGIHESFSLPFLNVANGSADVAINDSASNNNSALDPGESAKLTVKLTNPWRAASKAATAVNATLTTSTPGVTVFANSATYANIPAQGSATGTGFVVGLSSSVACGSSIAFTLTTTSSLGTTTTSFSLRVGVATGNDPVVTYTDTVSPALTIPDIQPRGIFRQLAITDDLQIADVNFRIDSVTHPFTGDLSFELRSPDAIGTDLIALIGEDRAGGGAGHNITNMVIDDAVASTTANDMVQAANSAAPFSKSWRPVFNAPWTTLVFGSTDPIGSLSRFNAKSTKGTWTMLASDQAGDDEGTLNKWSMIVTPVHFACSAVTPTVNITATKTVSGSFHPGGTVSYTITLTNNGNANQTDNPGHEFTDVLPAGLTLVNATATSGTTVTSSNTVNWDGSIAPLGGSVTITVTATVNAGTQGALISNQGVASFDSDANGSNNASVMTDDPSVGGANDPTTFTVTGAVVAATKTVSGKFNPYSTATYTITLTNTGNAATADNTGDELVDSLPPQLTLVDASATAGTVVTSGSVVKWNGGLAIGASVTITVHATVNPLTEGSTVSNQATVTFDASASGTNDTVIMTDDPNKPGTTDATDFVVIDLIFKDGFDL